MGLVHQLTVSNLLSKRLYAISPIFLMCISSGSMFNIISKLVWGVVLVKLVVRRHTNLFRLFNFWFNILVLILFPQIKL